MKDERRGLGAIKGATAGATLQKWVLLQILVSHKRWDEKNPFSWTRGCPLSSGCLVVISSMDLGRTAWV